MSVANEINRIKTNIANAYTKAEEKGATLPTEKNSANLADTIASITAGAGGTEDTEVVKNLVEGTLVEYDNTKVGATQLKGFAFYNDNSLTSANLTNITDIGASAFYNNASNSKLRNLILNPVINNIGKSVFYCGTSGSKIVSELSAEINGEVGEQAFYYLTKVQKVTFTGSPTSLGGSAFAFLGNNRTNPQDNINTYDFRNATFTQLLTSTFARNKYSIIRLPLTLATIATYVFEYCTNSDIYFYGEIPPTVSNANAFSGIGTATNIFVPYKSINNYKTTTNLTTVATYIKGFAPENTFVAGEELPLYDTNGYGLTWYSDKTLSTVITTMPDTQQEIYCTVGTEIVAYKLNISSYNANVTATDGVKIYKNGDMVANGTILTITANGTDNNTEKYYFTVNDVDFTSGGTHTINSSNVNIACVYWDGVNSPIKSTFADNDWVLIKAGSDKGLANTMWSLGDKKTETLNTGETVELQIIGFNHDDKSNGTGKAGLTLQMVNCLATLYAMSASNTNKGGWGASDIRTLTLPKIKSTLSSDLQTVITLVNKKAANGGGSYYSATETLSDDLFLLSEIELTGKVTYSQDGDNEGTQYDYWVNHNTDANRIKKYDSNRDGTPETATIWRLRSSKSNYIYGFMTVSTTGSCGNSNYPANTGYGVSFALCI